MVPKVFHWIGLAACVLLIVSCFLPWAYFNDPTIPGEAQRTFTGFFSYQNSYGKPGKFLLIIALLAMACMLLPKIWAKRSNLFVCALGVGYAIKSFILFTSCYNAYCPERRMGIYLMLLATIVMLVASLFPNLQLPPTDNKKPEINPVL
ncbi:MAG: hypothetical protein V4725_17525 [Bacteroidota bacterium]|nr:hypothetical protein [Ferruginibacter sp.]